MAYDGQKVAAWIGSRKPECPVCKSKNWTTTGGTHGMLKGITTSAPGQSGGAFHFENYVPFTCNSCGYLMLVSPQGMGFTI
jgi:hypothetical protein